MNPGFYRKQKVARDFENFVNNPSVQSLDYRLTNPEIICLLQKYPSLSIMKEGSPYRASRFYKCIISKR